MIRTRVTAVLLGILLAIRFPQLALAADENDVLTGPWPTISGVAATGDSAMTASTNPAGMSHFHKRESIVRLALAYGESESSGEIPDLGISGESSDDGLVGIPAYYHTRPLNDAWDFGISVTAPAGFGDDYGNDDFRRYFATEWSLFYLAVAPAISYKVNDRFSLGASLNLNYANYQLENKVLNVDSPGVDDGDAELDADGTTVSFTAGLMYRFSDTTRLGLIYRSGADVSLDDKPKFKNLSPNTQALIEASGRADQKVKLESELPPISILGLYHEFDSGLAMSVDLAHIGWSDFRLTELAFAGDNLIERRTDYDDALAGSIGFSIPYRPGIVLGVAAGYLESPVTDLERSYLFRIDDAWMVGFGAEFKRSGKRSIAVSLNYGESSDGRVETGTLPLLGEINSEYDSRQFVVLDFKYKWR